VATVVGILKSILTLDVSGFGKGMLRAQKDIARFQTGVSRIGSSLTFFGGAFGLAFTGRAIVGGIKRRIDDLDSMAEAADRVGVDVRKLAGLKFAGKFFDVDPATIEVGLSRLGIAASNAAAGGKAASEAFRELGLDAKALIKLPLDEQFSAVADAMKNVANASDRLRLTRTIFGRGATQGLARLLGSGSAGLAARQAQAEASGNAPTRAVVRDAERAADAIDELKLSLTGLGNTLTTKLAPSLTAVVDVATAITKGQGLGSITPGAAQAAVAFAQMVSPSSVKQPVLKQSAIGAMRFKSFEQRREERTAERMAEHQRIIEESASRRSAIKEAGDFRRRMLIDRKERLEAELFKAGAGARSKRWQNDTTPANAPVKAIEKQNKISEEMRDYLRSIDESMRREEQRQLKANSSGGVNIN